MAKKTTKKKTTKKKTKVDFPNVRTSSRADTPPKPKTLNVCGNIIPVRDGKAGEADPKVLRKRARERAKAKKENLDETRI